MEIKFGFAILAYYTWWVIVLLCLVIVLYKLVTNQNFFVGFRVGIQSNREDTQNMVFEPILVQRQGQTQSAVVNRNGNNANVTPDGRTTGTELSEFSRLSKQLETSKLGKHAS